MNYCIEMHICVLVKFTFKYEVCPARSAHFGGDVHQAHIGVHDLALGQLVRIVVDEVIFGHLELKCIEIVP